MPVNRGVRRILRRLKVAFLIFGVLVFADDNFAQQKTDRLLVQPPSEQTNRSTKRVALVIGNLYRGEVKLKNPGNDALDMGEMLSRLGFELVGGKAHIDISQRQTEDLVNEFSDKLKGGGIGVFYFAGHGVQIDRVNYLIPFDAAERISSISDMKYFGIQVDWISEKMSESNGLLNILIFDACRNNPWRRLFGRAGGTDGLTLPSSLATGTFLAFAASDGQIASDNPQGRNGLYTQELLKNLRVPGMRLEDVFINTRVAVEDLSKGKQTPDERSKLKGVFYFSPLNTYSMPSSSVSKIEKLPMPRISSLSSIPIPFVEIGKYGFKDAEGKVVINPKYDYAGKFSGGLAAINLNGKWGYVDENGNEVIPLKYDFVDEFNGFINSFQPEGKFEISTGDPDTAAVRLNGKAGLIDKKGNVIVPFEYDEVRKFSEGLASVKSNGKYGFVNKSGKIIILPIYEYTSSFSKGMTRVQLNKKYGFIDTSGKAVIPIIYDEIGYSLQENLIRAELNGKYGFLDRNGKAIIPFKYSDAGWFSERFVSVKFNGKYGYINEKGDEIIPFTYSEAKAFKDGLAQVKLNGKYGFIDTIGKVIIPIKYDGVDYNGFNNGLVGVELNGKKLYVTRSGVEINR